MNRFRFSVQSLIVGLMLLSGLTFAETAEQKDERMEWWREARFGLFIHWGVYAIPAGHPLRRAIQFAGGP